MLLADFVLKADGAEPQARVRAAAGNRLKTVYYGSLSQWNTLKPDLKKYGKCVICFYEGDAVMSIDRTEQKDLARELVLNSGMLSEIFPDDRSVLYFADKKSTGDVRRALAGAGGVIISEHLVPDSFLSVDAVLLDYYRRVCLREFKLGTGVVEESKMLAYRLQELRSRLLPVLCLVLLLTIASSLIEIKTAAEMNGLTALKQSYSGALKKNVRNDDEIGKTLSSCQEHLPHQASHVFGWLASYRPSGVEFRSIEVKGSRVIIDGMAISSDSISAFADSVAGNELFTMTEVSDVRRSSIAGRMDFRLSATLKAQKPGE